jgi:Flp pilus assembly protein TadD
MTRLPRSFFRCQYPPAAALLVAAALQFSWIPAHADEAAEVRAMAATGNLAGALQRSEQALASKPRDTQLRFLHGVMLMDNQRDEAAMTVFTQMSQEYPELPDPYNNIALLHARAGRLEQAMAAVQEALRAEPSHRTAKANLGQLHLMLAVKTWESMARGGPIDPTLQRRLDGARALLASTGIAAR